MRIIRRIQLAGFVALAGAGATQQAHADDLNITTATTNPVFTATAAGTPASPGDVNVATNGSITVDAVGEVAITVNSNNDVTNLGTLAATNVNNTGGIQILNGFSGTITNGGSINITDGYVLSDTDSDGDLDGEFATGTGRFGIALDAGTFTGNIINNGALNIEGNNSYGIVLNGLLDGNGTTTGNLTSTGDTRIIGDNNIGISVQGGITGDLISRGDIAVMGEGSQAIVVDSIIGGEMRLSGSITATGFHHVPRVANPTTFEPLDDLLLADAVIQVNQSVAGGFTVEGIGVADDDDDDGDGTNDEADDNAGAVIASYGSAPSILIQADGADVNLGPAPGLGGYGLRNMGEIASNGVYDNFGAVGVRLEGVGASNVTTAAGLYNEGGIGATAREESAIGLHLGSNVSVPLINNLGSIEAVASGVTGGDTATGILIDAGATNVAAINNSGTLTAVVSGNGNSAIVVRDLSGTLTTITNTNVIGAAVVPTDADAPVTGQAIALDLSNALSGVTITQTENADTDIVERLQGDVLLGDFADTINLQAGLMTGDVSFGLGADQFNIDGADFTGTISDTGDLDISVLDGSMHLTGGNATISDATFGAGSTLTVDLSGDGLDPPLIQASGVVTFAADAVVVPGVPTGLVEATQVFLTANSMFGGNNVTGIITGADTPFVYNLEIALTNPLAAEGAANGLEASYTLKSAAQLGLTDNQSAAFDPIIEALRLDDTASEAFVGLDNQAAFIDAYQDLMPSYAAASAELAATAIQQGQSATSNRMSALRLQGLDEVSVWVQEIGYGLNREPPTPNGQEFRGHGFGVAMGIDGPLDNGALFGLSGAFIASEAEEPARDEGQIAASIGELNAYFGTAMGPFDIDLIGGLGVGKMESRRFVSIGETYSAETEADWWAWEGHGAARISAPMSLGDWLVVTPQAALTYVMLNEEGYTEEGGGDAIDYQVDETSSQRLWGDVGVEFAGRLRTGARGIIAPRIFAGYRANLIDDEAERTFRFVSGGDDFTLVDEALGDGGPLVGIGVDATNGYSTISLGYEGEFGEQIERHSLNVAVRFRF